MISRYYGSLDRPTNTRNCRRPEREENPIPSLSVWLEFYKDILQFRWITPSKAQSAVCAWFYTRSTLCAAWKTLTARQSGSKDLAETYVFRLDSRIYKLLPLFCISRNNNCSCHFVNLKSRSTDAPRWAKTICCCCHVEIINGCDFFSFWTIAFCQRKTFKWKYKVMKRRKKNRVTAVLLRIRRTENQEKKEKPTGGTQFTGSLQPLDSCLLLPNFLFFLFAPRSYIQLWRVYQAWTEKKKSRKIRRGAMGRYAADKPCTSDLLINVCWGHRLPSPSSTSSAFFFVFFFSLSFLQIDVKSVWGTCFTPTDGPLEQTGC